MSTLTDLFDFDKLYNFDGTCLLCGEHQESGHGPKCPGELLDKNHWELHATVKYGGCGCGCTPWSTVNAHGQDITEVAKKIVASTRGEVWECRKVALTYTSDMNLTREVEREIERIEREADELEEARENASERKERLETYTRSVQALNAERGDLIPAAYERRLKELKDAYKDVL
jgi:DNA repair exonuclease SbcCD ATPase subunit